MVGKVLDFWNSLLKATKNSKSVLILYLSPKETVRKEKC